MESCRLFLSAGRTKICFPGIMVAVLLAVISTRAQNSPPPIKLSPEMTARIEKAAENFLSSTKTPGIAIGVVLDGRPGLAKGYGMADLENSVPVTNETLFRLASVSKPITAVVVMQLYERGKLDLDVEVQKYCPAFPKKEWPITTRELLGHLGGIRHYDEDGKRDIPTDSAKHFSSAVESLKIFADDPLVAKPGTKFQYSTYGYTLLGCVVEGAAQGCYKNYEDYAYENVLRPSFMWKTRSDDPFIVVAHRSRWYHKDELGTVHNAGVLDSSYKIPGGGLLSSAVDMVEFEAAVLNGKILKDSTRQLMWTPQKTTDGQSTHYGLGWGIIQKHGMTLYAHTGGQQGTSTSIILAPERHAGVVVLANMDGVDAAALSDEILKIVLDLKDTTP